MPGSGRQAHGAGCTGPAEPERPRFHAAEYGIVAICLNDFDMGPGFRSSSGSWSMFRAEHAGQRPAGCSGPEERLDTRLVRILLMRAGQ